MLAVLFVGAGVMHFVAPDPYVAIVPPALPAPRLLVYMSGAFEILGGLGLLVPRTRLFATWGLIALLAAVFPANVYMALDPTAVGAAGIPEWLLWARLPLQFVLAAWIYRVREG